MMVSNDQQRTGDIESACLRYGLGRASIEKIGADAKAIIRIGRRKIYNFQKMDAYMNTISE